MGVGVSELYFKVTPVASFFVLFFVGWGRVQLVQPLVFVQTCETIGASFYLWLSGVVDSHVSRLARGHKPGTCTPGTAVACKEEKQNTKCIKMPLPQNKSMIYFFSPAV